MDISLFDIGTHDMTGVKSVGQDASFGSNLCWVWWPGKTRDPVYGADCIDGKTGLKTNYQESASIMDDSIELLPSYSACSTFGLFQAHMKILLSCRMPNMPDSKTDKLSLADLRQMKNQVSAQYEAAKADFLQHRVFNEWSCRYC